MSEVLQYLDCGCAIMKDGSRHFCPTCAEGEHRRTPDPDLLALLREAAFTLEQARQWVEGDEATHGRQYGTGNSIRSVLARIDAKLSELT